MSCSASSRCSPATAEAIDERPEVVHDSAGLPRMAEHRILLVEDDDDVAGAMVAVLEGEGYSVVRARDGEDALRALREGLAPCLIVLDILMPRMDGIEFRRVQRSDPSMSHIPVVVVSGVANMLDDIR